MFQYVLYKKKRRHFDFNVVLDALVGGSKFGSHGSGSDSTQDHLEDCEAMLASDMALVSVKMASPVYTRSRRSLRMTMADKIASFGNTFFQR